MTTTTPLDQALQVARQLAPADQARLVSQLVTELATRHGPAAAEPDATEAWARLEAFWQEIEALGPTAPSVADQLEADRRTRQEAIEGREHVHS